MTVEGVTVKWVVKGDLILRLTTFLIFVAAFVLRLHGLNARHAFDLDEGVYWETLRAMQSGGTLYRDIFFSQPPLFLLSIYPIYIALGKTIYAARLGAAIFSLVGLCGLYMTGRGIAGRSGGPLAVLLAVASPAYLAMSQTLQAEAPAMGFSLLSAGVAFCAFRGKVTRERMMLSAFVGISLAIGLLSKFLTVATLIPIAILLAMHVWQSLNDDAGWKAALSPILAFVAGFATVAGAVAIIFSAEMHALVTQVIAFHVSAESAFHLRQSGNAALISSALISPLGAAAALGVVSAVIRRNGAVVPIALWLVATVVMLLHLVPLFNHHLVALVGPLVGLAILPFAPQTHDIQTSPNPGFLRIAAAGTMVIAAGFGFQQQAQYFSSAKAVCVYGSTRQEDRRALDDLLVRTRPAARVVTDAQFLVALSGRDTPPWLVDTTLVRVNAGQLSGQELIERSSDKNVDAVLFFGHRLSRLSAYRSWVKGHFQLASRYGDGNELWVR